MDVETPPMNKGSGRRAPVHLAALGAALLAAGLLLAGCTGQATRDEGAARQDLGDVKSRYRPHDAKPPLPTLTETSGLPDLIQYALLNSPRAEAAFYDWAGAIEEITTARSLPDPMLTFGAAIGSGVPSLSLALITDPGQNWPGPGKLPLKADAAYGDALKKRAVFEGELLGAALAVKRAYYQLWVLEEEIRRTREVLALVDEVEAISRQRLAVGKAGEQDVLKTQMEQDRLKNQLAGLEDSRTAIAARLRAALGLGPDQALPKFALKLDPAAADFTEASLLETAFARNPRLKEMRAEVLQAVALYHLSEKSTVPDYSFGIGVGGPPVAVTPSVGMTLPIWRDKIAAEIARGSSGMTAANARLSAEALDLAVRFAETAYAWREANRNAELHGARLLPKAKAALAAARAGYVTGGSTFIDLLDAGRELLEHHMKHAEALGQREMVLAEMSLVILGKWPENVPGVVTGPGI